MKILVLGADGYLGWPTCMHLADLGHAVVAVDNYLKRRLESEVGGEPLVEVGDLSHRSARYEMCSSGRHVRVQEGDCTNYDFLAQLIQRFQPDAVVHYAEQPSGPYSIMGHREADLTLVNNTRSTLALAYAIMDHAPSCHIVKLGTMGEYGTPNTDIPEGFFDFEYNGRKERRLFPREAGSFYHTTKILDTDLLWYWCRMKGLRVTDLMQGPVYGIFTPQTRLHEELTTRLHYDDIFGTCLNRFVVQAAVGHPLTVYGAGGQTRGYLDLRDTLACVTLAIENPADRGELRVFNQFTELFSAMDLAKMVRQASQVTEGVPEAEIRHIDNPRIEKEEHHYQADNTGLTDLGLEPHKLTRDTVVEMIEYAKKHHDRVDSQYFAPRVSWR